MLEATLDQNQRPVAGIPAKGTRENAQLEQLIGKLHNNGGRTSVLTRGARSVDDKGVVRQKIQLGGVHADPSLLLAGFSAPFREYQPTSGTVYGERLYLVQRGCTGFALRHMPSRPHSTAQVTLVSADDPCRVREALLCELVNIASGDVVLALRALDAEDLVSVLGMSTEMVATPLSAMERRRVVARVSNALLPQPAVVGA